MNGKLGQLMDTTGSNQVVASMKTLSNRTIIDQAGRYCAEHGTNARFKLNVRFRQQVIRRLPQLPAAGFACPAAAAPLGATHPAPSVGAYKTGIIPQMRRRNGRRLKLPRVA
jgi:hypothetical protein